AQLAHQPLHRAPGHDDALPAQLPPDLARPVDLEVGVVDAQNLPLEPLIAHRAGRGHPARRGVVGRRGEPQHLADRLGGTELVPVLADELDYLGSLGSSSRAKKALAAFRISLARRRSRTSRSSSAMRCASPVEVPGRWPPSISAWRTQLRSVSRFTPSLA